MRSSFKALLLSFLSVVLLVCCGVALSGCGDDDPVPAFGFETLSGANELSSIFESHLSVGYAYEYYLAGGAVRYEDYYFTKGTGAMFTIMTAEQAASRDGQCEFYDVMLPSGENRGFGDVLNFDYNAWRSYKTRSGMSMLGSGYFRRSGIEVVSDVEDNGDGTLSVLTDLSSDPSALYHLEIAGYSSASAIVGSYVVDSNTHQLISCKETATVDGVEVVLCRCAVSYDVPSSAMVIALDYNGFAPSSIADGSAFVK